MRRSRHYGHAAKTNDLALKGGRTLRPRLPLRGRGGRLRLSRGKASLTPSPHRKMDWSCAATRPKPAMAAASRIVAPPVRSDGSPDGSMSMFLRPCSGDLTSDPEKMRQRRRNGRAPLRHHQGPDGRNPLPDEDAATGCRRDGVTRAGLQYDAGHEHHGHQTANCGDEGVVPRRRTSVRCCEPAQGG